jgi:hypothetical protein
MTSTRIIHHGHGHYYVLDHPAITAALVKSGEPYDAATEHAGVLYDAERKTVSDVRTVSMSDVDKYLASSGATVVTASRTPSALRKLLATGVFETATQRQERIRATLAGAVNTARTQARDAYTSAVASPTPQDDYAVDFALRAALRHLADAEKEYSHIAGALADEQDTAYRVDPAEERAARRSREAGAALADAAVRQLDIESTIVDLHDRVINGPFHESEGHVRTRDRMLREHARTYGEAANNRIVDRLEEMSKVRFSSGRRVN